MFVGLQFLGWTILIVAYVPVALLLVWMARRFGTHSSAFIGTVLITSLPFVAAIAEAGYVEYNWRALCATAKTEVKRKVIVEGFYDNGFFNSGWAILKGGQNGFRFVEWKDGEGRLWRTEGFADPELETVRIDKPSARYHWYAMRVPMKVAHLVERREDTIVDTHTGEIVARHIAGYRYPAFIDRIWRRWFDSKPEECGSKRVVWGEVLVGIDRKEEFK